jgi:hypothetical protein
MAAIKKCTDGIKFNSDRYVACMSKEGESPIKHPDGSVSRFGLSAGRILRIVKCEEYRIRQTALNTIEVEIGGADQLSGDQIVALNSLFKERAGDEFQIHIKPVRNINWGNDAKRLAFRSEVL